MTSKELLREYEAIRARFDSRRADEDDGHWVTINGTHVLIDDEGVAQSGGKLKGMAFSKAQSKEKTTERKNSEAEQGSKKGTKGKDLSGEKNETGNAAEKSVSAKHKNVIKELQSLEEVKSDRNKQLYASAELDKVEEGAVFEYTEYNGNGGSRKVAYVCVGKRGTETLWSKIDRKGYPDEQMKMPSSMVAEYMNFRNGIKFGDNCITSLSEIQAERGKKTKTKSSGPNEKKESKQARLAMAKFADSAPDERRSNADKAKKLLNSLENGSELSHTVVGNDGKKKVITYRKIGNRLWEAISGGRAREHIDDDIIFDVKLNGFDDGCIRSEKEAYDYHRKK